MFKIFQTVVNGSGEMAGMVKKAMFDGSSFVGKIKDISIDIAPPLADAIYRILYETIRQAERERKIPAMP